MTKYDDLRQKTAKNVKEFETYEQDCRQFIIDLRSALISYLKCLDDRVIWLPFSSDEPTESMEAKGVIEVSPDRRMVLYKDAFYGFALRINLYDPKSVLHGGNYLDLPMFVKKKGEKFTIKLGDVAKTVTRDDLPDLSEYMISKIEDFLDTEFDAFLEGEEREFGFLAIAKSSSEE